MATVNAVILKDGGKEDGTWNVKICVNHKSKARYIKTESYVDKRYLDGKGKLKKTFIDKHFSPILTTYREAITDLGNRVKSMSVDDVRDHLVNLENIKKGVDLFYELDNHIAELRAENKIPQSYTFTSVINHLKDFTQQTEFNVEKLTPGFLYSFEDYLRQDKVITRQTRAGSLCRPRKIKGVKTNGIINYMNYLSSFINHLQRKHNNPRADYFPIPDPFSQYEIPKATKRRKRNIDVEKIVEIILYQPAGFWENISKDLFLLSFYLCGINPKDMYVYLTDPEIRGELEYGRCKVKDHRADGGVTNVKIPAAAVEIIKKYGGFIQERYSNNLSLNQALSKGWRKISERLGFKVTMYYARHTFGNIARKICKFSKDDVSFALNHKYGIDVTDVYVEPDWDVVHKVQAAVIKVVEDALDKYRKEVA
ncbi:site-specific integrase [Sphingobacterium sp. InxBP1]|uniref:phage integrase SAM-like domain-containing protein n=1 Tax=Sphingobacterium sp. InxBP1 TaxID=2870328 RepID=UPI0022446540|nr:phage integrase SAM-like domain-containing protein [Sphingobacterium sp. InxBP1]MCW8314177.1 site-specific integrase [Sphingobacterium sp. InxBP1]